MRKFAQNLVNATQRILFIFPMGTVFLQFLVWTGSEPVAFLSSPSILNAEAMETSRPVVPFDSLDTFSELPSSFIKAGIPDCRHNSAKTDWIFTHLSLVNQNKQEQTELFFFQLKFYSWACNYS